MWIRMITFSIDINLRFGAGKYTIWAGDNQKRFDGKIRFIVNSEAAEDKPLYLRISFCRLYGSEHTQIG